MAVRRASSSRCSMPITRLRRILAGRIERIGLPEATFVVKGLNKADNFTRSVTAPDHTAAVGILMDWIEERIRRGQLAAVGHRVVHGGPKYSEPQRITPEMVEELHQLQSVRSRASAGGDPADRGISSPVSRSAAGGVFRHGVSPRPAARSPVVADPAPLRGARGAAVRISRLVVCVSDGGTGARGWTGSGARPGDSGPPRQRREPGRGASRARRSTPAWASPRRRACR